MISKKLKILQALTAHLEGITPAWADFAGWEAGVFECPYDLSKDVYRGRPEFGDETKPPFLAILEAPRQLDPFVAGSGKLVNDETWSLLIQGFVKDNKKHPLDPAYDLLAWVQMRMSMIVEESKNGSVGGKFPLTFRLGGLIGGINFQIPIVRPGKDNVSDTAYFYMPISVGCVTDLAKPFVQE